MSRSTGFAVVKLVTNTGLFLVYTDTVFPRPLCALAFDFTDAKVIEEQGIFQISVSTTREAPPEYIKNALIDDVQSNRLCHNKADT